MTLASPFRTKDAEPLCMIAEKCCEQIKEEIILFTLADPLPEPACFFTPYSPFALPCHNPGNAHATDHSIACQLCRSLYLFVIHECVGLQSQRGSAPQLWGHFPKASSGGRSTVLRLIRRRHSDWCLVVGRDALLHHMLKTSEGAHDDVPVLAHNVDAVIDMAAQCRRDERVGSKVRVDKGPA